MTEYLTKGEYSRQKARLTRAKNTGDPAKVLEAVEATLDEWNGKAWPDDWHRWSVALDDAYFAYLRYVDYPGTETPLEARFRAAFDRIHS